jgi:hypothetical protein
MADQNLGAAGRHGFRNPSLHNMRRAGLTEVHARPSWVWRNPALGER